MRCASQIALVFGFTVLFGCHQGVWAPVRAALDAERLDQALPAYDRARAEDGDDPDVVVELAKLLLQQSVQSGDRRQADAAITQLRMASRRGQATLQKLLDVLGPGPSRVQTMAALERVARDETIQARLRKALRAHLASSDPSILRTALPFAQLEDRAQLERALASADRTVKAAALRRLLQLVPEPWMIEAAREAFSGRDAFVRRAAVGLLVASPQTRDRVFAMFSDADPLIRLAALQALSQQRDLATDHALLRALGAQLTWPPSTLSVAAAQVLARADPLQSQPALLPANAVRYLERVLVESNKSSLRSQAAIALMLVEPSLSLRHLLGEVSARLPSHERDLQLQVARALLMDPQAAPMAFEALQKLLDRCDMPAVQSAQILSEEDDGALAMRGSALLRRCIEPAMAPDASVRRTAARALGDAAGDLASARACLSDPQALVRIFCAGGIVSHVPRD